MASGRVLVGDSPVTSGSEFNVTIIFLRRSRAAAVRFGAAVPPIGRLLNRDDLQVLKSAELPREGVLVRRQPSLTRRADGAYVRWTTRRVLVGKGEGSSRLAFDAAIPRRPRPNT